MDDLYGKAEFTAEEIGAMRRALDECGVRDMPAFRKVIVKIVFVLQCLSDIVTTSRHGKKIVTGR